MTTHALPTFNAVMNGIATVLITSGYVAIRRGNRRLHRACMLAAAAASALFLTGYVTYHARMHGLHTPFGGHGFIRPVYFLILWTHIPLAMAIAFLVPRTFIYALKGDFERHRAWARITFPIWEYVSVTGVLVYLFLYQWWPSVGPVLK